MATWSTPALSYTHCLMFKFQILRLFLLNYPTASHFDFSGRWQNRLNVKLWKERPIIEFYFAQIKNNLCSTLLKRFSQWNTMGLPYHFPTQIPLKKNAGSFLSWPCSDKSPWSKVIMIPTHIFLLSCLMNPWNSQINPSPSLRHSKRAKCSSVTKNYTSGNSACYL